jgi:MFS family permease
MQEDRAVRRWGPAPTTRLSGLVAAVGVILAVGGPDLGTALAGFALMGAGYALVAPLAFSRAAADPAVPPGVAIAGVATFGYGGLLLGPPFIGFVAAGTSLPAGFGLLGGFALLIAVLAGALASPPGRRKDLRDRQDLRPIQQGIESPSRG